ncbi:unnamed protein product [Lampetra planeri]
MCKGIGYNQTYMPNAFNHDSQDEAGLEVHQFWPLVEIHCSPDLLFFLCSMYTPICLHDYRKPLPPCRAVCDRAKAGCAPLMRQYGFAWPDRMNCDRLPAQGDSSNLCMDDNRTEQGAGGSTTTTTTRRPLAVKPTPQPRGAKTNRGEQRCDRGCSCKAPMVPITSERHPLHNKARVGMVVPNCAMPCHSPYFSAEEMTFASLWIGLWSVACFFASLTTVLTFMIDVRRFQYPERPIVLISSCYLFVSLGYIVRLVAGHDGVACSREPERRHVLYETTGPALCTTVFLLTYFFSMASSIWWVILSFTWFLAAGLKWGSEAIASYSQYFHMAAWLLPSVKSIAILAMSSVDGDPVAGICSVGNQSLDTLRGFVLAPMVVYLLIGVMFIMAGFVSLFRIRSVIKQGGKKTDKLDKLMLRIGVVTVLYTLPAAVLVGCYFYEQHHREAWERAHNCDCVPEAQRERPAFAVFMLKYFMCLVAGITSGVWIWSAKTLDSWKRLCSRCCSRGRSKRGGGGGTAGAVGGGVSGRTAMGHVGMPHPLQVRLAHV